ncbi:hypothetical protein [Streptomyces sp. CAU 1734]|uniref:hypothetical protein n=1 Tax=Streptomyces sp. CAU 1734 TaxID=3140360 RepID=UPI0032604342
MTTSRHTPARIVIAATLAALALGGCAGPSRDGGAEAPTPVPRRTSAAELCTALVSHWAGEALKGSTWAGLDWEQKGLSNEQYAIHEDVLAAARAEERRQGRAAALELIGDQTKARCEALKGATGSSENWRPPSHNPKIVTESNYFGNVKSTHFR